MSEHKINHPMATCCSRPGTVGYRLFYRGAKAQMIRLLDAGYLSPEQVEAKCRECGIEDVKEEFALAARGLGELQEQVQQRDSKGHFLPVVRRRVRA